MHTYEDLDSGICVDVAKLFEAAEENQVVNVEVKEFVENGYLREYCWEDDVMWIISPQEVLDNPERYKKHWDRIQKADVGYPIFLYRDDKKLHLVDGRHRLAHAVHHKHETILCTFLTKEQVDACSLPSLPKEM